MRKVVELRNVVKSFGEIAAVNGVAFEVLEGQCVSLLGPSGCGKTTTLRIIAGFEAPDRGEVLIDGEDMRGRRPYERNIGLVFQDYALFPHMSVEQNIAYGMRHRGVDRAEIPRRLAEVLATVKLSGYERRRPSRLSGGEQQRVALARALATRPAVMLLDEPMSNLDAKLREQVRLELKEILSAVGSTTIIVTHDQQEAMSLAEHVIVMSKGRVMQRGTPSQIYAQPANKFVAEFIGKTNWFAGRLGGERGSGLRAFEGEGGLRLMVAGGNVAFGEPCEVGVRPERITLLRAPGVADADPGQNLLSGKIVRTSYLGADLHLWIELTSGHRVLAVEKNLGQDAGQPGASVGLRFDAESCIVLSAQDGEPGALRPRA
jgi:ABC-type Fe3+/spermidine/putrescine transport system ATPase subunit